MINSLLRNLSHYQLGSLNRVKQLGLSLLEVFLPSKVSYPPIFILGAPRSGSTLLVQAITEAFDIGYISNCHCKWYGAPALAEIFFKPTLNRVPTCFESQHGTTQGSYAPSECGQYWYRFFRRKPAYVSISDISIRKLNRFHQSVSSLISAVGKPVAFKNLYAGLRLQPIVKTFPNALFIIIKRCEIDNGHSILEGRLKSLGNYDDWWSVEPPNIDELSSLPSYQQVIEQIRSIYKLIDEELSLCQVREEQVFRINYEEFCSNPNLAIENISIFFSANHLDVPICTKLPKSFPIRQSIRIDPLVYQEMVSYSIATIELTLNQ